VSKQRRETILERKLEHRVVDVVAASTRVQLAGDLDAEATDQLALDIKEEVLVLAGVLEPVEIEMAQDVVERIQDGARLLRPEQVAFGEQHGARLVDAHLVAPVVALHALEQRREDGVLVHLRREFLGLGHRA
jgi:hypothetical protein